MGTSASTAQEISPAITSSSNSSSSVAESTTLSPMMSPTFIPLPRSSSFPNGSSPPQIEEHANDPELKEANQRSLSSDGYKWRKYGQKSVKGCNFPRNYYKCTHSGCTVRKFVEQCEVDGKIVDRICYKGGEHNHDSIIVTRLNATDQQTFKKSVLSENRPVSKHELLKREGEQVVESPSPAESSSNWVAFPHSNTPRLVVETATDVDHLDDGYNWRKYGQKKVKGSPNPRSYYKCTEYDCSVKKQVEKRGNTIINTYEGTHNHPAPGANSSMKKKRKIMPTHLTTLPKHADILLNEKSSPSEIHALPERDTNSPVVHVLTRMPTTPSAVSQEVAEENKKQAGNQRQDQEYDNSEDQEFISEDEPLQVEDYE